MKITGLDKLARQTDELARFAKAIDGDLVTVKFDPNDTTSVQEAIRQMERAVDAKAAPFRSNSLVMNLAVQTKEKFRQAIRARKASS